MAGQKKKIGRHLRRETEKEEISRLESQIKDLVSVLVDFVGGGLIEIHPLLYRRSKKEVLASSSFESSPFQKRHFPVWKKRDSLR